MIVCSFKNDMIREMESERCVPTRITFLTREEERYCGMWVVVLTSNEGHPHYPNWGIGRWGKENDDYAFLVYVGSLVVYRSFRVQPSQTSHDIHSNDEEEDDDEGLTVERECIHKWTNVCSLSFTLDCQQTCLSRRVRKEEKIIKGNIKGLNWRNEERNSGNKQMTKSRVSSRS